MQNFKVFDSTSPMPKQNAFHMWDIPKADFYPVQGHTKNRYVYVKQNFMNPKENVNPKVLINPHFGKKVFVNPNFHSGASNTLEVSTATINVHTPESPLRHQIHVNPTVLNIPAIISIPICSQTKLNSISNNKNVEVSTHTKSLYSTKNKLISTSSNPNIERKKRQSIYSAYKIVKSSVLNDSPKLKKNRQLSVHSAHKIIKSSILNSPIENGRRKSKELLKTKHNLIKSPYLYTYSMSRLKNKFKLDNRSKLDTQNLQKNRRFLYVNKLLSIRELAKIIPPKQTKNMSLVKLNGVSYKRLSNKTNQANGTIRGDKLASTSKSQRNIICKSKYRIIRKYLSNKSREGILGSQKLRRQKASENLNKSNGKLRTCNIPCPYFRKYGKCKGRDSGKCFRKHNPDQIALCSKFLQGACIEDKCLMSHNVSPEKMPTCKFYLEGVCAKENCPYLHVRISPKADICKDFIEGFCKKASKCNKRHQYLCPDFEKTDVCLKQRCPYPHGHMVRKYSVFNKQKFAKKSSHPIENANNTDVKDKIIDNVASSKLDTNNIPTCELNVKARYYAEQNTNGNIQIENTQSISSNDCDTKSDLKSRPKLGNLPSFIALEEIK